MMNIKEGTGLQSLGYMQRSILLLFVACKVVHNDLIVVILWLAA